MKSLKKHLITKELEPVTKAYPTLYKSYSSNRQTEHVKFSVNLALRGFIKWMIPLGCAAFSTDRITSTFLG